VPVDERKGEEELGAQGGKKGREGGREGHTHGHGRTTTEQKRVSVVAASRGGVMGAVVGRGRLFLLLFVAATPTRGLVGRWRNGV
jgi:hypothetical protein